MSTCDLSTGLNDQKSSSDVAQAISKNRNKVSWPHRKNRDIETNISAVENHHHPCLPLLATADIDGREM